MKKFEVTSFARSNAGIHSVQQSCSVSTTALVLGFGIEVREVHVGKVLVQVLGSGKVLGDGVNWKCWIILPTQDMRNVCI